MGEPAAWDLTTGTWSRTPAVQTFTFKAPGPAWVHGIIAWNARDEIITRIEAIVAGLPLRPGRMLISPRMDIRVNVYAPEVPREHLRVEATIVPIAADVWAQIEAFDTPAFVQGERCPKCGAPRPWWCAPCTERGSPRPWNGGPL